MNITPEMVTAWSNLQRIAHTLRGLNGPTDLEKLIAEAIDVLDDSNFMVPIEEVGNERETAAQFAASDVDPAEWGDTTREDTARRQGLDPDREAIISQRMFRP